MQLESKIKILIGAGVVLFCFLSLRRSLEKHCFEKVINMLIFCMKDYPSGGLRSPGDNGHSLDTPEVV